MEKSKYQPSGSVCGTVAGRLCLVLLPGAAGTGDRYCTVLLRYAKIQELFRSVHAKSAGADELIELRSLMEANASARHAAAICPQYVLVHH